MVIKTIPVQLLLLLLLLSCGEERESLTVQRGDIVEAVYSSVVLEPEEMYKVNSSVPGYIDQITVKVGDTVDAGFPLMYIRDVIAANNASNARLSFEMAERYYFGEVNLLQDLKLELQNAELKRRNDSIQYVKYKKLFDDRLITSAEMDQIELAHTASTNTVKALRNKLKRSEKELGNSMQQARNNMNSSVSRSEEAVIRNRMKGVVYDLQKEPGEYVNMQEPVAVVGSAKNFVIKMLIDEIDISKVQKGQRIIINLEAYGNKTFEAIVTRISPKMDTRTQTFEVEGTFVSMPDRLYYGLTGEANIVIAEKKNALVIPREYIVGNDQVETSDGLKRIKLGTMSLTHALVLEGLTEGAVIFKPM